MRQNSEVILAAFQKEESNRESVAAARGLYWPRIDLQSRLSRIDDPITIALDPIRQAMLKLHPTVLSAAVPPFFLEVQKNVFWRTQL